MKKRFLGIICLLYVLIILYVKSADILKNFLAPNMQIYLNLSIIPLIIMGLILCFNKKINYKFKISDLILILPIIMLILSSDGRLTSNFASNRMTNFNTEKKKIKEEIKEKEQENIKDAKSDEIENNDENTYDFSNTYFDVVDESYYELANYLTFVSDPNKYAGKTIRVRGFVTKNESYIPNGYFALGKFSVSCCAADALFVGFIVKTDNHKIKNNAWYEIEGVLEKAKDQAGYDILAIKIINIKNINGKKEEQYVYPCYAYDDGKCSILDQYDLE